MQARFPYEQRPTNIWLGRSPADRLLSGAEKRRVQKWEVSTVLRTRGWERSCQKENVQTVEDPSGRIGKKERSLAAGRAILNPN
jgi:hypothetical protein